MTAPLTPPSGGTANPDEVICPNCVHQFRAIPENVQRELQAERQRCEGLEERLDRMLASPLRKLQNIEEGLRMTGREQAEWDADVALLRECRVVLAAMATEYEIGDEASELQHWPAAEVARCRKAVELRDKIDAAIDAASGEAG